MVVLQLTRRLGLVLYCMPCMLHTGAFAGYPLESVQGYVVEGVTGSHPACI